MASRSHRIFPAVFHGDLASVRKILQAEPDAISVRNAKNLSPLHVAASRGQLQVVKYLLGKGATITGPSGRDEWTPLMFAAFRGHFDTVELLLNAGAPADDKAGNPIHFAGQRGHRAICRLLVEHGAVDNLVRAKDADLVDLFRATYSFDADSVADILQRRPELVNRKDKNGRTPLHEACTHGDRRTVKLLLNSGANINATDRRGQTPLHRAQAHGKSAVIKLLESQ